MYVRANLYDALQQLPDAPGLQLKRWYTFNGDRQRVTDLQVAAAEGDVALVKYVDRGLFSSVGLLTVGRICFEEPILMRRTQRAGLL